MSRLPRKLRDQANAAAKRSCGRAVRPSAAARKKPQPQPDPHHDWIISYGTPAGEAPEHRGHLARPAIAARYAGTRGAADNKTAAANRRLFDESLFILSQSKTGRYLLERLAQHGYQFAFDDAACDKIEAAAQCDHETRTIVIHNQQDPAYLALLLAHESAHALQSCDADLGPDASHRPEEAIRLSFAVEADAYAHQCQVALELAAGDPDGPGDQVRFDGPLHEMRRRFPALIAAAERAMHKPDALESGAAAAAAFEAFYSDYHLRSFYERTHMNWAENLTEDTKKKNPQRLRHYFNRAADANAVKKSLRLRGQPYIETQRPHLDLDDTRHSGITRETARRIENFYAQHKPGQPLPVLRHYGLHAGDSCRIISFGMKNTSIKISKNK